MKTYLFRFNLLIIGMFFIVTSCEVETDDVHREKDPERLARAQKEKRRREDNLRKGDYEADNYSDYEEYEDEYYEEDDYNPSYAYDISSDEAYLDNKWRKVDYGDYEAYFEYGHPNQSLEGMVLIKKVGESIDFPELQIGDKANKIERSYSRNFPNHPANGFSCKELYLGYYHDITEYRARSKGSRYVDVEAIYSVDVDGEMFLILVENGGGVTQEFLNSYEEFVEGLIIE